MIKGFTIFIIETHIQVMIFIALGVSKVWRDNAYGHFMA